MAEKKQVWIDTDLSVGMKRTHREGYADVDDGYAILQLMKSKEVEIIGMSTVFGNTDIDNAFRLCNYMVDEFSPFKIPVFKGAGEKVDLANVETNDAVDALAKALEKQKLTILAIGPATNIGLLLLKYPQLANRVNEVVLVAGRRTATDYFKIGNKGAHAPDLNFDLDNDAFRILFENGVKVVLCPFEISNHVWLTATDLDTLEKHENGNKWLADASRVWLDQWLVQGEKGFNPFDVLASHYIIAPEDIVQEELHAHLEIHPNDLIADDKSFKQFLLCDTSHGAPVTYCYDVVPEYHEKLMQSLLK